MTSEYQQMSDGQRANFWADVAIGTMHGDPTNGLLGMIQAFIRDRVRAAYMQGLRDGKAIERGESPDYEDERC